MKRKLGEILVTSGAVTGADIDAALLEQDAGEPSRLGDLLVSSGKLSSAQLAQALAAQYDLPYVELPPLPQAVLDLVPMELQRQYRFVPLKSDGTELHVAMADLANLEVVATLEQQWTKVHVSVASGDEIDALHATLSGLFEVPQPHAPPASSGSGPTIDELFGSLELEPTLPEAPPPGVPSVSPSQVMRIASAVSAAPVAGAATSRSSSSLPAVAPVIPPSATKSSSSALPAVAPAVAPASTKSSSSSLPAVAPVASQVPHIAPVVAPSPAPPSGAPAPLADDLFSDLNLDSVRTGIPAKPPAEPPPPSAPEPVKTTTAPLGLATSVRVVEPPPVTEPPLPDVEPERAPGELREVSGPVLVGVAEGTGPLLEMLAREGTGPVVDTPFFKDELAEPLVPTMSDAPFVSSRSSVSAIVATPVATPAPAAAPLEPPPPAEDLPDWLRDTSAPPAEAPAPAGTPVAPPSAATVATSLAPQPWTGALDHLMPSKLVVGLTRVLLAKGLVTEAEILAALGQKK